MKRRNSARSASSCSASEARERIEESEEADKGEPLVVDDAMLTSITCEGGRIESSGSFVRSYVGEKTQADCFVLDQRHHAQIVEGVRNQLHQLGELRVVHRGDRVMDGRDLLADLGQQAVCFDD